MYQHLHAVGASVGKEIGGVGMGYSKDLNDSGQRGVDTGGDPKGSDPFTGQLRLRPHLAESRRSRAER